MWNSFFSIILDREILNLFVNGRPENSWEVRIGAEVRVFSHYTSKTRDQVMGILLVMLAKATFGENMSVSSASSIYDSDTISTASTPELPEYVDATVASDDEWSEPEQEPEGDHPEQDDYRAQFAQVSSDPRSLVSVSVSFSLSYRFFSLFLLIPTHPPPPSLSACMPVSFSIPCFTPSSSLLVFTHSFSSPHLLALCVRIVSPPPPVPARTLYPRTNFVMRTAMCASTPYQTAVGGGGGGGGRGERTRVTAHTAFGAAEEAGRASEAGGHVHAVPGAGQSRGRRRTARIPARVRLNNG